jgi:hypothetical protein
MYELIKSHAKSVRRCFSIVYGKKASWIVATLGNKHTSYFTPGWRKINYGSLDPKSRFEVIVCNGE